ncbi:putative glycoside hydrolase [Ornithinibacillus xuwenensis]|uniref:Glycoside hydrolase n=1 Tax=Ornithinibacillus xuwenensis TaxID=3144668 RepID=A0ABU9XI10_9BACI
MLTFFILFMFITGCTNDAQDEAQTTPITPDGDYAIDDNTPISNERISSEDPANATGISDLLQEDTSLESNQKENKKDITPKKPDKVEVKGLYLNRTSIKEENIQKYIDLIKGTNLNAAVIDIKDDFGKLTYDSNIDLVNQIGSDSNPATRDLAKLIKRLKEEGIYTIARIVVFKDPYLAANKTDFSMKRSDGSVWQDAAGTKWVDPYKKEVWNYITSIAQEAADSGFDEIQYDYIRFPENGKKVDQEVAFANPENRTKAENILAFLNYSNEQLQEYPVYVSADVFGLVTTATDDMGIGQVWENISPNVDYISPMTYPSHYAPGSYGIKNPDASPYDVMLQAMQDAKQRNQKLKTNGKHAATIRPWIQDFDYKRSYTIQDVQNQIKALNDQGITQYLIWNATNVYTKEAYK